MNIQKVMEQKDLLTIIEEKLVLYDDKVRFRAVSKLWNTIPPKIPDLRAKQLPWLLYQLPDDSRDASHGLFNPLDKNNYFLDLQEYKGNYFGGSSYGWVQYIIDEHSYLINPLTKTRVELSRWDNFPGTTTKIIWSSPPSSDDCVLVGFDPGREFVFCQPKDGTWSRFIDDFSVLDIIFHKGKLHALTFGKTIKVVVFERIIDSMKFKKIGSPVPTTTSGKAYYLVESSDEELMVVVQAYYDIGTLGFRVYKYDPNRLRWFRVESIGDQVLFILNERSSGIAVSCRDFPELKRNCVYFSVEKYNEQGVGVNVGVRVSFEVFNLEDNTIEFGFQWGPMNIANHSLYDSTVWVTPSLI